MPALARVKVRKQLNKIGEAVKKELKHDWVFTVSLEKEVKKRMKKKYPRMPMPSFWALVHIR